MNIKFSQQRKQSQYEQEISCILYKIIQKYNLPAFSLSYCQLSTRGENVKVYLFFAREANKEVVIELMNKKYSHLIKKEIAKSKKFSYIPNLVFLLDKELETISNLKKILQKSTANHEN